MAAAAAAAVDGHVCHSSLAESNEVEWSLSYYVGTMPE